MTKGLQCSFKETFLYISNRQKRQRIDSEPTASIAWNQCASSILGKAY